MQKTSLLQAYQEQKAIYNPIQPILSLYFYFENNANPNADSWFFATATSPNEFGCVELNERKDRREMVVATVNAYGKTSGISNKDKVPFEMEEVAEGIFKVTFKKPVDKGEYCFLYASEAPTRYSNNKVFDFGISRERLFLYKMVMPKYPIKMKREMSKRQI